jgi:predicted AlkP superfamily phosphohydrolase/phosphomutase
VPTFLSFYTHEPDTVQHFEWKWFEPERFPFVDAEETKRRRDRIPERYRAFDRFLGELRTRLGPEAAIVVVSDHGHSPTVLHQDYYSQHRHGPPGIFVAAGGPLRRSVGLDSTASIYDVFPTVLYLLGLPIPEDAPGRLLESAIEPGALAASPPRRIGTYEGRWPALFTTDPGSGLEAEELEKLRALGYL